MELEEQVIDEICALIKDNIKVYMNSDKYFNKIRDYYRNSEKIIPYNKLYAMTREVMDDLLKVEYLYDFRDLE